jgi:hypothetical protein
MYRNLARQVSMLPNIASFNMVELDCDDLKRGLASKSHSFAEQLLTRLATDHRNENIRYRNVDILCGTCTVYMLHCLPVTRQSKVSVHRIEINMCCNKSRNLHVL